MPQPQKVTFIYTNSHDATAILLVTPIGADRLFRFNFNMWRDYKIQLSDSGFEIQNPVGRRVGIDDWPTFQLAQAAVREPVGRNWNAE